jgi:DNA-binding NtrC family response regulator
MKFSARLLDAGSRDKKELMVSSKSSTRALTVLLVEADVLVRFALGDHLRGCGITVVEAVNGDDARAVLVAGPEIHVLLSDAQLAEAESGFALAQWVRRHRPELEILLTGSIMTKAQAVASLTARIPECRPDADAATLATRLNGMLAERKRRLRQQPKPAPIKRKRRQA